RHVHVAADGTAQSFGNHGLPIARRAIEKDCLVGVGRWTELLEDVIADDEMSEAAAQTLTIDEPARGRERAHLLHVAGERYWRGADVLIDVEILQRAGAAQVGHRIAIAGR